MPVYLIYFRKRYRHAGHYLGNPESSAFLKVGRRTGGRELAELKGSVRVADWSASGESHHQVRVAHWPAATGSAQTQAGAVEYLFDEPQCLGEVLRAALVGPAEDSQAVLQLVEGEPLGRAGVQLAVLEVAGQERLEDRRVQAVVGVPQEVLHWVAGGGGLEVEYGYHLQVTVGGWADCGVAGAVVAVQQAGPQPVGLADGRFEPVQFVAGAAHQRWWDIVEVGCLGADGAGPGEHVPGQRGGTVSLPGAKAGESAEGMQGGQPSAERVVELPAPWGVQFAAAGPDVVSGDPGLQRPRHAAVALGHDAVAEQARYRQAMAGQELKSGDLAGLLGAAIGQVGLEDRLVADGEDLVAVLFLQQPGRGRAAGQVARRRFDLAGGQPLMPHRSSPPEGMPRHLIVAVLAGWAGLGAVADGGGVTDPEQVGELERVTPAGKSFVQEPVGAQVNSYWSLTDAPLRSTLLLFSGRYFPSRARGCAAPARGGGRARIAAVAALPRRAFPCMLSPSSRETSR